MEKVIQAIKKHKKFIITAHINLEGDSIGSQLAMKELLEKLGKTALIVDNDLVPDHYRFLPGSKDISNRLDRVPDFDAAVVLDCPTLKRIGRVSNLLTKDKTVINIDHHISNEKFGDAIWVDPEASSAGEMVYLLFKKFDVELSRDAALVLYIAILTDTGSFNYDNTTGTTHKIAGELLGYGLKPATVSEDVYDRRSATDISFLGLVLSTIKVNKTGEVAYLEITNEMLKTTGADVAKSEGFVNYARSIEGVKVAVIFKEETKSPGIVNVSFRSKGDADVNVIASAFGGGGHVKASGCVIAGSLSDVRTKVLSKIEETLSNGRNNSNR
ncbi:MAG: bifunctional oligoribonuclease/PAP phosphatase NrnA [Candidatus Omnitrophica bacterium]|nr:bifunctional oligoribonuclease/PAP phosphatase NrnA [Candidatus Omnitrophota bacterium]